MNYLCFRFARSNDYLRKHSATRNSLYFKKGLEKLDKEADIGYIIKQTRILRYFLKTVLDKDQLTLLKLKSRSFIPSDDDDRPNSFTHKKKFKDELMTERYVENLQRKTLTKNDVRLLEVLGFRETLDVLNKQKEKDEKARLTLGNSGNRSHHSLMLAINDS